MMIDLDVQASEGGYFSVQYGGGVPGKALVYVSDGWDVANQFFSAEELRGIAKAADHAARELEAE